MTVIGTCKLCTSVNVELIDSHVVPRWAYRRLRERPGAPNPNPVQMQSGTAVQTSKQVSRPLLCAPCDQKLGVADNYVAQLAYNEDRRPAPVSGQLGARTKVDGMELADASALDIEKLCMFGASVIWRGHAARSDGEKIGPRASDLGTFGEEFRRYLRGEVGFPPDARLVMIFYEDLENAFPGRPVDLMIVLPEMEQVEGRVLHRFVVCGFQFDLTLGADQPEGMKALCLHHASDKRVIVLRPSGSGIVRNLREVVPRVTSRGQLAKRN